MASSCFPAAPPAAAAALQLPTCWAAQPREWRRGEGPGSSGGSGSGSSNSSPAPSPDCCGGASPGWRPWPRAEPGAGGAGRARRGTGQQRRSASQREKLRMRRLAQALRTLRRHLPASVAPAGHCLTKIETLRLAVRYIGHLAALLGLAAQPAALGGLPAPTARRRPPPSPGLPPGLEAAAWLRLDAPKPREDERPAAQSLPTELLAFLDAFLPTPARA